MLMTTGRRNLARGGERRKIAASLVCSTNWIKLRLKKESFMISSMIVFAVTISAVCYISVRITVK